MNRILRCGHVIYLLVLSAYSGIVAADLDAAMVAALLSRLEDAFYAESPVDLDVISAEILVFDADNSDALYARALLSHDEQSKTRSTIEKLENAIFADSWYVFSAHDAYALLAALYFRTRSYQSAVEAVEATAPMYRNGYFATDTLFAVYTRSQYELGNSELARDALERGLALFPNSTVLQEIIYEYSVQDMIKESAYWLAKQVSPTDTRVLERFLETLRDDILFQSLYRKYLAIGGSALPLLLRGEEPDSDFLLKTIAATTLDYENILALQRYQRRHPRAYGSMVQMLHTYTSVTSDADSDNFFEERYLLDKGRITAWIADWNQDGHPEFEIRFFGRLPQQLRFGDGDNSFVVSYDSYPFVGSVRRHHNTGLALYVLRPGGYSLPLIDDISPYTRSGENGVYLLSEQAGISIHAGIRLHEPLKLPNMQDIIDHSYIRYVQSDEELAGYMQGEKIFSAQYDNATQNITQITLLHNAIPRYSARDIDLDEYIDAVFYYSQGMLDSTVYTDGALHSRTNDFDMLPSHQNSENSIPLIVFESVAQYLKTAWNTIDSE